MIYYHYLAKLHAECATIDGVAEFVEPICDMEQYRELKEMIYNKFCPCGDFKSSNVSIMSLTVLHKD